MKRMKIGYRLLIIALLLCGMTLSLVACESAYYDLTEQIQAQNPQFTIPGKTEGKTEENTKIPQESKDIIAIDPYPAVTTPADPCMNGHTVVIDPEVAPTCEADGKTQGKHCEVCGKVLVKQVKLPAEGHHSSLLIDPVYEGGLRFCYCIRCDKILYELPYNTVELQSSFDCDEDGVFDVYTLSNYLPKRFLSDGAIKIPGESHLDTDVGVVTLERIYGSGIYHYYFDFTKNKDIPLEDMTMTWEFEVCEDGTYEICFDLAMKVGEAQRGIVMQIDGGQKRFMDYYITPELAETVGDETQGSYMTGMSVELKAGGHVIQMTANVLCPRSFQFRNIYLVKVS